MTHAYYKTTSPEVLAALLHRDEEIKRIRAKGDEFAAAFGGKFLNHNGVSGYRVANGLVFDPPKPARLWTVPDRKAMNMQRPRITIAKATAEEKAELVAIRSKWGDLFPTEEVPFEPVLNSMGISYGNLIFGGAFSLTEHEGVVYVMTSAKLNDCMIEILASEFDAIKAAQKATGEPA